jgi:ribosomal protein S18 acetylase RimI-like enzyme
VHRPTVGRLDPRWLRALAEIEQICYSPEIAYPPLTLALWLLDPQALFLGLWTGKDLAAAQISDLATGQLITLDVHPHWRRRGLGRRLLRDTLSLHRRWGQHRRVTCEIATDNEPSLELHREEGFEIVAHLPHYYEDGSDAHLLTRAL